MASGGANLRIQPNGEIHVEGLPHAEEFLLSALKLMLLEMREAGSPSMANFLHQDLQSAGVEIKALQPGEGGAGLIRQGYLDQQTVAAQGRQQQISQQYRT